MGLAVWVDGGDMEAQGGQGGLQVKVRYSRLEFGSEVDD